VKNGRGRERGGLVESAGSTGEWWSDWSHGGERHGWMWIDKASRAFSSSHSTKLQVLSSERKKKKRDCSDFRLWPIVRIIDSVMDLDLDQRSSFHSKADSPFKSHIEM